MVGGGGGESSGRAQIFDYMATGSATRHARVAWYGGLRVPRNRRRWRHPGAALFLRRPGGNPACACFCQSSGDNAGWPLTARRPLSESRFRVFYTQLINRGLGRRFPQTVADGGRDSAQGFGRTARSVQAGSSAIYSRSCWAEINHLQRLPDQRSFKRRTAVHVEVSMAMALISPLLRMAQKLSDIQRINRRLP